MEPRSKSRRTAPNAPRNGALARIHILKSECKLSDDEYRDLIGLLTNGRTRSSGDASFEERARIVAHLQVLRRKLAPASARAARAPLSGPQKKVFALWKALENAGVVHSSDTKSLRAFVQRQTGLSALEFCNPQACSTLIESLKQWAKRSGVELRG